MFLKRTRADKQQQVSDFHLRKPKCIWVKDLSDATSSSANSSIGSSLPSLASSSLTIQEQAQDIYEENEILSLQSELSEDFPINSGNDFYDNISSENQNTNRTNQEFDEQVYDGNEKQNHYSGDTGPYFPNFTIFLLFLWVTKHQIGIWLILHCLAAANYIIYLIYYF